MPHIVFPYAVVVFTLLIQWVMMHAIWSSAHNMHRTDLRGRGPNKHSCSTPPMHWIYTYEVYRRVTNPTPLNQFKYTSSYLLSVVITFFLNIKISHRGHEYNSPHTLLARTTKRDRRRNFMI